jgi:medium-chain acyl-[acyl-carrier-protein] hydrolase
VTAFPDPGAWIRQERPKAEARLRLFCLPYGGGGASLFRRWAARMPPGIEVLPVQLPGREGRFTEPPFNRLFPLVRALAAALRPWLDIPFAIFGHSMGALVGFELARNLRMTQSCLPKHLFLSACPAPQISNGRAKIYNLPEPAFFDGLRRLHRTPPAFLQEPELLSIFLPLLRADFAVFETYTYVEEHPLACPITAFCGSEDSLAGPSEVGAWRSQTTASFSMHMIPGDHFFIHGSEDLLVKAVAAAMPAAAA